jgi:hypothetical protein
MTLFLIAAASVAIVWAPAMRIFRVSGAVAILALGIPGFAILAGLLFRPSVSEMSGLDHAPNAFYVSGQAWNAVGAFSAIGAAVFLGGLGVSLVLMLFKDNSSLAEHGPLVIELPARAIWISLIALISQIIGVGPATVLKSDSYLASTGPSEVRAALVSRQASF